MYVGVNVCVWMCVGVCVAYTESGTSCTPSPMCSCASMQAKHPVRSLVGTSWTTCFIR